MEISDEIIIATIHLLLRSIGLVAFFPFPLDSTGVLARIVIAFGFGASALSYISPVDNISWENAAIEILIGISLGLPCALVVWGAEAVGEIIDVSRGETIGALYDPTAQTSLASSSKICRYFVLSVLLFSGILSIEMEALKQSLDRFPIGSHGVGDLQSLARLIVATTITFVTTTIVVGVTFISLLVVTELAIAFIAKASRLSLGQSESFIAKTIAALLLMLLLLQRDPSSDLLNAATPTLGFFSR